MDSLQLAQQRAKRNVAFSMFITSCFAIFFAIILCFHYTVVGLEEENQRLEDINCTTCRQKNVTKWVELDDYYLKPFPLPAVLVAMLGQSNQFLISLNIFTAVTTNDFFGGTRLMKRRNEVDVLCTSFLTIYLVIVLVTDTLVGFILWTLVFLMYLEIIVNYYFKGAVNHWIEVGQSTIGELLTSYRGICNISLTLPYTNESNLQSV